MDGIRSFWIMVSGEFTWIRLWQGLAAFAAAFVMTAVFRRAPRFAARLGRGWGWLAENPGRSVAAAALLPVAARLALLPAFPPPVPVIHDEFSHLLLADTLRHGRLANPPHPFAGHFEVAHVIQHPAYASVYPPGPGASLALGWLLFGHPWAGVLLTYGAMCGACCWMLRAWMPARWALAGAFGCAVLFAPQWLNSYWGGSFAAAGGGLLFGSIPRLIATRRSGFAWLGMAGWAMGWLARPFEALVVGAVLAIAVLVWLWRTRNPWIVRGIGVPALSAAGLLAAFTGYYNYRVTGDPLLLPYQAGQAVYGFPQSFAWQELRRPAEFRTPALRDNFLWQVENRQFLSTPWNWAGQLLKRGFETWKAFWGVPLLVPVAVFLAASRDPGRRFLIAALGAAVFANSFYSFFFPHYFATLAPVLLFCAVDGIRRIAGVRFGGAAALGFALFGAVSAAGWFSGREAAGDALANPGGRQAVLERLHGMPGRHLVFVTYAPDHVFHFEWCYNGADIDGSKVVWANRLSPERDRELRAYFKERRTWIVDADSPRPEPRPFEP